jgi:general secretion pathway protein L
VRGVLLELLIWWAQRMRELIPIRRSTRHGYTTRALIVCVAGPPGVPPASVTLALRRNGREELLGRFALEPAGIEACRRALGNRGGIKAAILRLDPGALLDRTATFPLAAERDILSVLRYEMDRLTPFRSDQLYWAPSAIRRDPRNRRLYARVVFTSRDWLQPVLSMLEALHLPAAGIEAAGADGETRRISLALPDSVRDAWRRGGTVAAGAACAGLAVIAVLLPLFVQNQVRARIEAEISRLRPQVTEAEALRQKIASKQGGADAVAGERARLRDPVQILAALTEILPDDSFLTDLKLSQSTLVITGQSKMAARLIAALAADPLFTDPAFVAPITRAEDRQADLFSIRVGLRP